MTQYMLSVHGSADDEMPDETTIAQMYADVDRFNEKLQAEGAWVFAGGLQPPTVATTVRAHEGDVVITDGPYAETKEHLGGFWIIEAADLDEALDWAKKGSAACQGAVEVRPFQEEE